MQGQGASIFFSGYTNQGDLTRCNFEGNTAYESGGAVFFDTCTSVSWKDCNFTNNIANSSMGGGIYIGKAQFVGFTNCNFKNNMARYLGGAVALDYVANQFYTNCSFSNC